MSFSIIFILRLGLLGDRSFIGKLKKMVKIKPSEYVLSIKITRFCFDLKTCFFYRISSRMASTIIPSSPPSKNDSEQREKLHSAHKAVKAVNALFFLGFALITFREVYLCFEKYVSFPKYTTLKFVSQREVDFPSITFCPNIMSRFKQDALQVYI